MSVTDIGGALLHSKADKNWASMRNLAPMQTVTRMNQVKHDKNDSVPLESTTDTEYELFENEVHRE